MTADSSTPFLLVDSGNFLFSRKMVSPANQSDMDRAEGMIDTYAALGYTCVNVGPFDIAAGFEILQENSDFPFVSASFKNEKGEYVFQPYMILQHAGVSIGITGLSRPPFGESEKNSFIDWRESLPEVIAELQAKTEFIILLSALPDNDNENILSSHPQVRLLISSSTSRRNIAPRIVNNGLLAQTSDRGKYLGRLRLSNFTHTYSSRDINAEIETIRQDRSAIDLRLSQLKERSAPADSSRISRLEERRDKLIVRLEKLTEELADMENTEHARFEGEFLPLSEGIAEDPVIQTLVNRIQGGR